MYEKKGLFILVWFYAWGVLLVDHCLNFVLVSVAHVLCCLILFVSQFVWMFF